MDDAAIFIEVTIGDDRRIGDEFAVNFQRRHDLANDAETIGLVCRERFAQQARDHRLFATDHDGEKVGRPADRRRAVLGAGLTEASEILCNREVASHADFLAAADAHAVDAANHRLVAANNRRNHVVEQPHIAAVFLRIAGVVLGVFLGVASGAKRLVAGAGEDHRNDVARRAGGAKCQNGRLHHIGRVGVELAGVVERDPGVEQPGHRLAVGSLHRTLLVVHAFGDRLARLLGNEIVILGFGILRGGDAGNFSGHRAAPNGAGTRTARRLIAPAWTASNT